MERNILLDYVKIILSILVITIHMQPLFDYGEFRGWIITHGIARVAVPIFFITGGYYIAGKLDDVKSLKKVPETFGYYPHCMEPYISTDYYRYDL